MKVSKLIEELKEAMKDVGDVDVVIIGDFGDYCSYEVRVGAVYDVGDGIKYPEDVEDDDDIDEDTPIVIGISDY